MAPGTNSHCLVTSHAFRYVHKGPGYFWNGCIVSQTWSARDVGPNITGELGPALAQNSGTINNLVSGAISIDRSHDGTDLIGGSHWSAKGLAFSASQSSSVYGISSDVQPRSILLSPCIKT